MEFWLNILSITLEGIVPIACVVIGALIMHWLKERGASQDDLEYVSVAYDLLTKAVLNTNQVWVDALKKEGNGLSAEQQVEAREKTIDIFKSMITEEVQLAIEKAYGSVDAWLNLNLESAVGEMKLLK